MSLEKVLDIQHPHAIQPSVAFSEHRELLSYCSFPHEPSLMAEKQRDDSLSLRHTHRCRVRLRTISDDLHNTALMVFDAFKSLCARRTRMECVSAAFVAILQGQRCFLATYCRGQLRLHANASHASMYTIFPASSRIGMWECGREASEINLSRSGKSDQLGTGSSRCVHATSSDHPIDPRHSGSDRSDSEAYDLGF